MTYDPVDANDDGIVESDVDNESVSTGAISTTIEDFDDVSGSRQFGTVFQNTSDVDLELRVNVTKPSGTTGEINAFLYSGPIANPAVGGNQQLEDGSKTPSDSVRIQQVLSATVESGNYYLIESFGDETDADTVWKEALKQ